MTRKEMSEIFAVLMLAYPRADMFKGGMAKLGPTIELWTTCNGDVDFWTGQQAVIRVCRECTFPPTIAEFRAAAKSVTDEIDAKARAVYQSMRSALTFARSLDALVESPLIGREGKMVIEAMGGPENLIDGNRWRMDEIIGTYKRLARDNLWLPNGVATEKMKRLEAPK